MQNSNEIFWILLELNSLLVMLLLEYFDYMSHMYYALDILYTRVPI